MLQADSVTLNFGANAILSGCYIECRKTEIVGLLGRNGSGKSSLLKTIYGVLQPDFIHLRIDDKVIRRNLKKSISYLPQGNFIPPFLLVSDVLKEVELQLVDPELNEKLNQLNNSQLRHLSGGEVRLLECLWVLSRPVDYVLLDEPFSGVAPLYIEILQKAIRKHSLNKGIILTDHLYRPLLKVSDRVVILHNKAIYSVKDEDDLILYNYIPE